MMIRSAPPMGALKVRLKRHRLPDGRRLFCTGRLEAAFLYDEIFVRRAYGPLGLDAGGSPCVFDVGAHIGLFSLFLKPRFGAVRIYAFEPMPRTFEALRRNRNRYFPQATLLNCGLAATRGRLAFRHYSKASGWSTARPDERVVRASLLTYFQRLRAERAGGVLGMLAVVVSLLPARLLRLLVDRALGAQRDLLCEVRTISDVIAEHRIDRVDLLKVDVEGGELGVLQGIAPEDWRRIRRVVMEVQVTGDELNRTLQLFESNGMKVETWQAPILRGTPYRYVGASRLLD
jgi:FkbM family methyltransferase